MNCRRCSFSFNGLIFCLFYLLLLCESSADLETLNVEDLCGDLNSVDLYLEDHKSAILRSVQNRSLDCEITLNTKSSNVNSRNEYVIISFSFLNLEPGDTLVIRDSLGNQLSLAKSTWMGKGKEENSFFFLGTVTIGYVTTTHSNTKELKFELVFNKARRHCGPNDFECLNEFCIQGNFVCDGHNQCGDLSDERNCLRLCHFNLHCNPGEFRCNNGTCISINKLCDGKEDCGDRTDESDCDGECQPYEFPCLNGYCIYKGNVCNSLNDCGDNSDENGCQRNCTSTEFRCRNGKCIPGGHVCGSGNNCGDWNDEEDCDRSCNRKEFKCRNKKCVPYKQVCDDQNECGDRSDEENCREQSKSLVAEQQKSFLIPIIACCYILVKVIVILLIRRKKKTQQPMEQHNRIRLVKQ